MKADPTTRPLMIFLTWGTRLAFTLCLAGLAWMVNAGPSIAVSDLQHLAPCPFPCTEIRGGSFVLVGVISILAVSAVRLVLCSALYFRAGDRRFAWISLLAFMLVLGSILFRLG
jgi:hypothetical protein